jgi:hypothetical protein
MIIKDYNSKTKESHMLISIRRPSQATVGRFLILASLLISVGVLIQS